MHFGENQLSRSLIGLSPLPTTHPPSFQPRWVRSSTTLYNRFNLAMGRSPRFGSRARDQKTPQFRLAFATDPPHGLTKPRTTNSQAHSSKGTPSPPQKKGSDGLKANGFRYYFTPLPGYFSPFPHGTMHYRSPGSIQAYPVVWADSQQIPRARCYSGNTPRQNTVKRPTRLSRTTVTHPKMFNPNHVIYHYPHPHAENGRRIPQPHAR